MFAELVEPNQLFVGIRDFGRHATLINVNTRHSDMYTELCNKGMIKKRNGQWIMTDKGQEYYKRMT